MSCWRGLRGWTEKWVERLDSYEKMRWGVAKLELLLWLERLDMDER